MTRHAAPAVTFGVLGALEAASAGGPVALKGPRQRAVLARLLIARGRVVPVDRLVSDLWPEPPDGAVAAIRTFVADLRRALEPGRPPRQPAALLVTTPPGYALRAAPDAVDAWRFETAVAAAAGQPPHDALRTLDAALALWRGPAYAECAGEAWARAEIDRLDELRLLAVERRAEALLALGRAAEAVSDLRAHAASVPLREDAWQLLAAALYRSGRQGDALAALREIRHALLTELGVDPGVRLRRLEADILTQAAHLEADLPAQVAHLDPPTVAPVGGRPFVGRAAELALLDQAAETAVARGGPVLALVSADAGSGKTALAEALTRRLAARGWATAWGRSPEYEGAPAAWPWTQITEALTPGADVTAAGGGDPAAARFRLHRAVLTRLAEVAGRGPVLLVLDDLHRADEGTLDLLAALVAEPGAGAVVGPVLVVAAYRATEFTPQLTAALARLARTEPVRVYLGGLPEAETGELAAAVAGPAVDAAAVRLIHRRSGGNPFFVRELARLLAAEGGAALERVPAGVRDVIRHRVARLPEPAQTVLRQAAVVGRDIDPDVLTALAETGQQREQVVDALDAALRAGFLTEAGGLRFTHILVRDTLYGDLSEVRRAGWHAAVAEALRRLRPDDVAALAHHFGRAGGRATAGPAAHYAAAAAAQAEARGNPHEAARLWRQALATRPDGGERERLAAVMGLGRALAVTGHLDEARRHRAAAVAAAERLADPVLTAEVVAAFGVPAVWPRNDDEELSAQIVRAAERALAGLPDGRTAERSRLLSTIALELRGTTTGLGRQAAERAEALARADGDPGLLALALNARFMHAFGRAGLAAERARIGAELVALAGAHELVTFEVLGHIILLQADCARADLDGADAHAKAIDRLAERYELPLAGLFTQWYAGLRLALHGHRAEAATAYRKAHERLAASAMPGMADGLLALALFALDRRPDPERDWGPYEPWIRPLALLDAGRRAEAAEALRALPPAPRDLLYEARLWLAARAAIALGDGPAMRRLHAELEPAAGELAGAGSGVLSLGPVGAVLADLRATLHGLVA